MAPDTPHLPPAASGDRSDLERATLRVISRRLISFLFVLYIVAFLDRVNVGFAALEMNRDLGLSPSVYGFGAGIFFVGYCMFEIPSNLILARTGARRWIARIMISWGVISTAMMFVRGPASFYALRFLLGVGEAGFFPGIIFYLSQWLPAEMRGRAIARFMVAIPLSSVIGAPISGALLGLDGWLGLAGWQLLFLVQGLPAVLLGVAVLRYLPDGPEDAAWLQPEQRKWLTERLAMERARSVEHHGFSTARALTSGVVWQIGLLAFLSISFGQYAIALWLPQIVSKFPGFSNVQIGFLAAIPNCVAAISMLIVAAHSDRTGERPLHIATASCVAAVAFLACAFVRSPAWTIVFLSVANAGLISSHGPFWPLPSKFLTGTAAAGGIGLINSISNLSGFVGPYTIGLLNSASADFTSGFIVLAFVALGGMTLALYLRRAPVLKEVK